MNRVLSSTLRLHQLLPLALLVMGGVWLYQCGNQMWNGLLALQWPAKPPELPTEPVPPSPLAVTVTLTATRDRPLFWDGRRPPPPTGGAGNALAEQPRLLGIVMESGQSNWAVLSQGVPPQRRVFRLKVGQAVGGYTVKSVRAGEVELVGPAGAVQLRPPRVNAP